MALHMMLHLYELFRNIIFAKCNIIKFFNTYLKIRVVMIQ